MSEPMSPGAAAVGSPEDLRIAAVHLRLGALTLARAELEDLERRGRLDVEGTGLLAEARWRMGGGERAMDAAEAHLQAGGSSPVCIAIAAEWAWAEGRTDDAHSLMRRLAAISQAELDALFAGMPRRAGWPSAPLAAEPDEAAPPSQAPGRRRVIPGPRDVIDAEPGALVRAEAAAGTTTAARQRPAARQRGHVDPAVELRRAREELGTRPERALVRLALVLRLDPTLAPVVLDTVSLRREPLAAVIRGDAQRLLGRHLEAEAAFDAAVESLEVP